MNILKVLLRHFYSLEDACKAKFRIISLTFIYTLSLCIAYVCKYNNYIVPYCTLLYYLCHNLS